MVLCGMKLHQHVSLKQPQTNESQRKTIPEETQIKSCICFFGFRRCDCRIHLWGHSSQTTRMRRVFTGSECHIRGSDLFQQSLVNLLRYTSGLKVRPAPPCCSVSAYHLLRFWIGPLCWCGWCRAQWGFVEFSLFTVLIGDAWRDFL